MIFCEKYLPAMKELKIGKEFIFSLLLFLFIDLLLLFSYFIHMDIDIKNLTVEQKANLFSQLWNLMGNVDELIPFDPKHKSTVKQRLESLRDNPKLVSSDELKKALHALDE